jgi:hypothetical protein
VPPSWAKSLDDYASWVENVIDQSGASLEMGWIHASELAPGLDEIVGLMYERQRLVFFDRTVLRFDFIVAAPDPPLVEYHFDYREASGRLIWRLDKHGGHELEVGGLTHVHYDPDDKGRVLPADEVDLEVAINRVQTGWMPERR